MNSVLCADWETVRFKVSKRSISPPAASLSTIMGPPISSEVPTIGCLAGGPVTSSEREAGAVVGA
eukprot:12926534-Prorocentrum_lima.AAC.1